MSEPVNPASWWWPKPEPDPQQPAGVRAQWKVMAGTIAGQADPAKTKTWDYTDEMYAADKALEPPPPENEQLPFYMLGPPHNNFTTQQSNALTYQLGLVNPGTSIYNWIKAEFTWYPE